MMTNSNNVKITVDTPRTKKGFDIFVEFSGQNKARLTSCNSDLMYCYLKDGKYYSELKRWKPKKNMRKHGSPYDRHSKVVLSRMITRLDRTIDNYITEMEAC